MAARNINTVEFEALALDSKPVLVDFWAPWCGYCRRIAQAYEMVARDWEDKIVVAKVNIDEEPVLADREKIEVIPTLVLYREGKALASIVAPQSKAAIDDFIRNALNL